MSEPKIHVISDVDAQGIEGVTSGLIARVLDQEVTALPNDLYIPPGALQVFLEAFEGPLDLLLYLIKKQNIDVLNIPIAEITRQYVAYVELMQDLHIELASEYLVMAAMLAEIKSRMLLPKPAEDAEEEGGDPRAELIRRLQEYERFKKAAQDIDELNRMERNSFQAMATALPMKVEQTPPEVSMDEIMKAFADVMRRAKLYVEHEVEKEKLSIRERMSIVLDKVGPSEFTPFQSLFTVEEGRMGVVVTLIAILELTRQSCLEFVQAEEFAPIYVKGKAGE